LYCKYPIGTGRDDVEVRWSGPVEFKPGTGDVVLTVDGARAVWAPSEGSRDLSVEVSSGEFAVQVNIAGTGDELSKRIAIEIFRKARPRLGLLGKVLD